MKKSFILFLSIVTVSLFGFFSLEAAGKKPFQTDEEAALYLTGRYRSGCRHYAARDWSKAADEFERVVYFFPCSPEAAEASYYLAICYFEMREYDFANAEFSGYLKTAEHPAFFEEAVYYKFCIAEHLKSGKKRRPFKNRYLPKWMSGQDLALTIYDEVISALPNHALTVSALNSKANLLYRMREYRSAIDTYQTLIRRFPDDPIVPVCYVNIAQAYVEQSKLEFQNPDILALAELNAQRFAEEFPEDEKLPVVERSIFLIKELYAKGLRDLGLFYERKNHPEASAIYYRSAIEEFPDTYVAEFCRMRLLTLCLNPVEANEESAE